MLNPKSRMEISLKILNVLGRLQIEWVCKVRCRKSHIRCLQILGGSASRNKLKQSIAKNPDSGFNYDEVFEPVVSKSGNKYVSFDFTFNFGINNIAVTGYIEEP